MARARNIKPGLYKNEELAECSIWARYLFPGLWMLADRDGRMEDRPKRIKAELLAFDSQDVEPLLGELAAHGFLVRYKNPNGSFIQIAKFKEHQTPHYSEKASVIKPPSLQEYSGKLAAVCANDIPRVLQESSGSALLIKRGSQPPDSLIPDSLIPDSTPLAPDAPRPRPMNGHRVSFDWQSFAFTGVTADDMRRWQEAYPAIAIPDQVDRAAIWLKANPKNRKSNYERFLVNWFTTSQDRAGRAAS